MYLGRGTWFGACVKRPGVARLIAGVLAARSRRLGQVQSALVSPVLEVRNNLVVNRVKKKKE